MPQVQNSSDVMELKGLRRKVPTELGHEVTKKLGGPAKAAEVFFNWTRGCGEIPELKVLLAGHKANPEIHHKRQAAVLANTLQLDRKGGTLGVSTQLSDSQSGVLVSTRFPQLTVVRYLVGGPSVLNAEDLARQDDEVASKTDGLVLTPDMVLKAHLKLVDVLREAGCSKDVVDAAAQRVLEIYQGYAQTRANPVKKPRCSCCSVQ